MKEYKGGTFVYPIGMNVVCFSHFFYIVLVFASDICSLVLEHLALFGSLLTFLDLESYTVAFFGFLTL